MDSSREDDTVATPPAYEYVFIKILPSGQESDCVETIADDALLVRVAQEERGHEGNLSRTQSIVPFFSMEHHDTLLDRGGVHMGCNSLSRLFSFSLPEASSDPSAAQNMNNMAMVFESAVTIHQWDNVFEDGAYKVLQISDVVAMVEEVEAASGSSDEGQHQNPTYYLTKHILDLYRQHQLDKTVRGRRLLLGRKGSDLDDYTLRPKPAVIFFDCDDCLYFDNWKIAGHLTTKIEDHCQHQFGLPKGYAYTLYKQHGTALRGLIAEGRIDKDCPKSIGGFLETVHDLPIHELLSPDLKLRDMIMRISPKVRKFVFTASVSHHAHRCLEALGIADLFEGIIDVKDCKLETKHSISSFEIAMQKAGVTDPESCVFVDDSVKNIESARKVGWRSVLVGRVGRDCGKPVSTEHAEHEIDRIHQLPDVLPELFME